MAMKMKAIGLFVEDLATMVAFYRDVVGLGIEWDGKDKSVIVVGQDTLRFMMYPRQDFEELAKQRFGYPEGLNGSFELAFDVQEPAEVDREYGRMVALGAQPVIAPETWPWGLRSCYVADPEGNLIEISTWVG